MRKVAGPSFHIVCPNERMSLKNKKNFQPEAPAPAGQTWLSGSWVKDEAVSFLNQSPPPMAILKNDSTKRYLNIFWNQHQPYYKNEVEDCFTAPWVRLHACKDYYDMAAILVDYPDVHVTINLSASLLRQLDEYIEKLYDFADIKSPHYEDIKYYPHGKLDRCLDLLIKPTEKWTDEDKIFAVSNFFNAEYNAQIGIFPGYRYLWEKKERISERKEGQRNKEITADDIKEFSLQDLRDLKVWFNLAWFDYSFQAGDVLLIGSNIDGSAVKPEESVALVDNLIKKGIDAGYGSANFTEEEAKDIVLEQYKIMKYVVPVHRYLQNRMSSDGRPQIEVVTTPFYHPILPLIHDSSVAGMANPWMDLPPVIFKAPEDAEAHVIKGIKYYEKFFGKKPRGMWPGEGAVSEDVIAAFQKNGIRWIATGDEVCLKSGHAGDNGLMYRIDSDKIYIDKDGPGGITDNSDAMSIVFRSLHDKIGFDYGYFHEKIDGIDAARDFLSHVKAWQHWHGVPAGDDIIVTNTADGENAWTNYWHDGHEFLKSLYGILNNSENQIKTTTPSIYLETHPVDSQWEIEPLAAGTWVRGEFAEWIGEQSENDAWTRLKLCRDALIASGIPKVDPLSNCPDPGDDRTGYFIWKAWDALYAAEGSDWFWWYGSDQGDGAGSDAKFSELHRIHMVNAYVFANKAGYKVEYPHEIIKPLDSSDRTIDVPLLTKEPSLSKKEIKTGVEEEIKISIKVYTEDNSKVEKVLADLTEFGIKEKVNLKISSGTYSANLKIPPQSLPGKRLIKIEAYSNKGIKSPDYAAVTVR